MVQIGSIAVEELRLWNTEGTSLNQAERKQLDNLLCEYVNCNELDLVPVVLSLGTIAHVTRNSYFIWGSSSPSLIGIGRKLGESRASVYF